MLYAHNFLNLGVDVILMTTVHSTFRLMVIVITIREMEKDIREAESVVLQA